MTEPLVSILIPVYNAGEYLRPSVLSILSQIYSNLEILIINDGSTDGCMDSISDINDSRLSVISKENGGRATALNRGLDEMSGEFYATQDADDISYPERIERLIRCLLTKPDLVAVFSGYDIILNRKTLAPRFGMKGIEQCRKDIKQMCMPTLDPTGMFRVSYIRDMRYETSLRVGAAYDYILRVGEKYPIMVLGECLYSHRRHAGSTCAQDPYRERNMVRHVLRRACERRGMDPEVYLSRLPALSAKLTHKEAHGWLIAHFMESVLDLRVARQYCQSLKTALQCISLRPYDPFYYKPLAYCFAPTGIIRRYRAMKAKPK